MRRQLESRHEYISMVMEAWFVVSILFGLSMIPLGYLGSQVGGGGGKSVGIGVGFGLCFFGLAGAAYATWLRFQAWFALRRFRAIARPDDRALRQMKQADLHNASLIGQTIIGAAAGILAGRAF